MVVEEIQEVLEDSKVDLMPVALILEISLTHSLEEQQEDLVVSLEWVIEDVIDQLKVVTF